MSDINTAIDVNTSGNDPVSETDLVSETAPAAAPAPDAAAPEPDAAAPAPDAAAPAQQINLLEVDITDEQVALNIIVGFLGVAQRRGVFAMNESAKIFECVNMFQQRKQK